MSTALVRQGSIAGLPALVTPIAEIGELRARIEAMQDLAFVCCPFTSLDTIPPYFRVSERVVVPDPVVNGGDIYQDNKFCGGNEAAPSKNLILRSPYFKVDAHRALPDLKMPLWPTGTGEAAATAHEAFMKRRGGAK